MTEIFSELLRIAGPIFGVLALSAILVDNFIRKSREVSPGSDAGLDHMSALSRAERFYSLKGMSVSNKILRLLDRSVILLLAPIFIYGLARTWYDSNEIQNTAIDFGQTTTVLVLLTVAAATIVSIFQTSSFLRAAARTRNSFASFVILLGDIFLSIKIGVFLLTIVLFIYLQLASAKESLVDDEPTIITIVSSKGKMFSNNFNFIGTPNSEDPNLSLFSPTVINEEKAIQLYIGHSNFSIIGKEAIKLDLAAISSEQKFDIRFITEINAEMLKIRVDPSDITPDARETWTRLWSFFDNIEDGFINLASGQTISADVYYFVDVGSDWRRVRYVCEDTKGEYIIADSLEDTNCSSFFTGISEAVLWPKDRMSLIYANNFLSQRVDLSILLFPPTLASILACWLVIGIKVSNFAHKFSSENFLLVKAAQDHISLLSVAIVAFLFFLISLI